MGRESGLLEVAELDGCSVHGAAECDWLDLPVRDGVVEEAYPRVQVLLGVVILAAEVVGAHGRDAVVVEVNYLRVEGGRQTIISEMKYRPCYTSCLLLDGLMLGLVLQHQQQQIIILLVYLHSPIF